MPQKPRPRTLRDLPFSVMLAIALGLLLAAALLRERGVVVHQEIRGPINAPVINHIRADQPTEINAEVRP